MTPSDHAGTLAQLRAIAARPGDALSAGAGRVNPDQKLLALCAMALECVLEANHLLVASRVASTDRNRLYDESRSCHRMAVPLMRDIYKLPAATAAGVFAKANLLRACEPGCSALARSLAADLIGHPVLCAALWPAQVGARP